MSEWIETTVGDLAASTRNALVGGPFGSNLVSKDYVDHGVPVIRGQNMGARWVAGDFAYVSSEKAQSLLWGLICQAFFLITVFGFWPHGPLVMIGSSEPI
jgi:hypothetical protein